MAQADTLTKPQTGEFSLFERLEQLEHENVFFGYDKDTGLKAIIGIHNTVLGPALGGTRVWNYTSEKAALTDVLRLSRGMSYKSSISGINLGGGKAVIINDNPYEPKTEAFWRSYGKFVESLNGKYITAEDVGTSTTIMETVNLETDHVVGLPEYMGGSGDPSPFTAYGTYLGMKAACKKAYGTDSLEGKKVLIQGVGHVGVYLAEHLKEENAVILVSDINEDRIAALAKDIKVTAVDVNKVYDEPMDIYAPCALGATLNNDTLSRLQCQVVAGAANNQLANEEEHGKMCIDKNIIYAPDFLINAGGVINCYFEIEGYHEDRVKAGVEKIYDRTIEVIETAEKENITTNSAALALAERRIEQIAKLNAKL